MVGFGAIVMVGTGDPARQGYSRPDYGAPVADPDGATNIERMARTFGERHTDAKNRLLQTLRDWDRIAKQKRPPTP